MSMSPTSYGQRLSAHEVEILTALAYGLSNRLIAKRLYSSEHTVRTHLKRMAVKLGASNRAHMVAIGFAQGYLRISSESLAPQPPAGAR